MVFNCTHSSMKDPLALPNISSGRVVRRLLPKSLRWRPRHARTGGVFGFVSAAASLRSWKPRYNKKTSRSLPSSTAYRHNDSKLPTSDYPAHVEIQQTNVIKRHHLLTSVASIGHILWNSCSTNVNRRLAEGVWRNKTDFGRRPTLKFTCTFEDVCVRSVYIATYETKALSYTCTCQ